MNLKNSAREESVKHMQGLVLNLGLKGIRAAVFDSNVRIIAYSHQKVNTFLNGDYVEQDPEEWWKKGLNCIKEILKKENKLDFITVTSSAACVIPIKVDGTCLMRAIMVSDKRAFSEARYIENLESFNKLPYKADAYYSIPRILWIKNNFPQIYNETHKFISPNDFFIYKLTNNFYIDELNATKYFSIDNNYPKELLLDLDIDQDKLPEIKPIGFKSKTSKHFLKEVGLDNEIMVIISTYDAICAFFGSGVKNEGDACDMSGTVTSLRVLTKKKLKKNEFRILEQKYKDWNIIGGSNNLGGSLIEWVLNVFYSKDDYTSLEQLAGHFSAKTGLIFLPYLLGERAPLWDNDVRGAFLGIERFHDKHDLARAVLESTGYILKQLIESIEENSIPISRLFVSGGLAKIDLINQIKADITGKKIFKLKETEATALGAYCLARHSIDAEFDPSSCAEIERIYTPDLTKNEIYSRGYQLFKKVYNDLKEFYEFRKEDLINDDPRRINL